MRHISIFRNDLEALNGLRIANDVVEENRAVFLDPRAGGFVTRWWIWERSCGRSYHGRSYVLPLGLALRAFLIAPVDDSADAIFFLEYEFGGSETSHRYTSPRTRRDESRDIKSTFPDLRSRIIIHLKFHILRPVTA